MAARKKKRKAQTFSDGVVTRAYGALRPVSPPAFHYNTDKRFSGKFLKSGAPKFTKAKVCKIESKRCPIQLVFTNGQPTLRMCDGSSPTDVLVQTPEEAQNIAEGVCTTCWPNKKLSQCAPRVGASNTRGLGKTKPKWMQCRSFGKMTAAREKRLPDAAFGLIEKKGRKKIRKYPMPDPKHAVAAKGRAKAQLNRGTLSKRKYNAIVKKADRVINACPGALRRK